MLEIKSFTFGPFQTNCYVVSINDKMVNEQMVLVVDPACSNEYERQQLENYINSQLKDFSRLSTLNSPLSIIATHGHLDHLWGAKWATEKWGVPVLMHEADIPMAKAMQDQYDLFGIGLKAEPFPIENLKSKILNHKFEIINTPGHTPGSICLYFPQSSINNHQSSILLSGDTLFQMGYGRTDLPGGNMGQLIDSLEHLFTLPANTIVYPGHGGFTTIGAERR